jgi:hypothetical protein
MTAKQEAQSLVDKFSPHAYGVWDKNGSKEERYHSKQCAHIAVNKLLEYSKAHGFIGLTEHYEQVKIEIENL